MINRTQELVCLRMGWDAVADMFVMVSSFLVFVHRLLAGAL